MSFGKLILIFAIILAVFGGIIFFQFRLNPTSGANTPKNTVKINNQTFNVEVVTTSDKQQLGLSGRKSLPQKQGMLFVFDKKEYHYFWMKNMKFPIDIIFIDNDKIVSIVKNAQPPKSNIDNLPLYKSAAPVDKVLEINANLTEKYKIKNGDTVEINLAK